MKLLQFKTHKTAQAGDTIVEVLIAIAITSAILVGAFSVSNHSTQAVRDSEEHTEAEQILQGQVELLREYVQSTPAANIPATAFCLDSGDNAQTGGAMSGCTTGDSLANFNEAVTITPQGNNLYDCVISWDSVQGGTAQEEFFYRVYPAS